MIVEKDDMMRVKIVEEKFTDVNTSEDESKAPYELTATINADGLGPVNWW